MQGDCGFVIGIILAWPEQFQIMWAPIALPPSVDISVLFEAFSTLIGVEIQASADLIEVGRGRCDGPILTKGPS